MRYDRVYRIASLSDMHVQSEPAQRVDCSHMIDRIADVLVVQF